MNETATDRGAYAAAYMDIADSAIRAARQACDSAAMQDNIPDSIVADFARKAARAKILRDEVYAGIHNIGGKDIDDADAASINLECLSDDIDNELVAADVRMLSTT